MMNEIIEGLWIGDIHDAREGDTSRFDLVVTVCQDDVSDNVSCDNVHFPLSDGTPHPESNNPGRFGYELFEQSVDTIVSAVEDGKTVLVHCHAGRSRSVMAVTAALTKLDDTHFDDAFWTVKSRNGAQPSDEIRRFATRYVNRNKHGRKVE